MERLTRSSKEAPTFKGMIYARPGAGKTTLAATCAYHEDLRDVLFLDREGGMLSVQEGLPDLKEEHLPIVHRIYSVADLEAVFWRLRQGSDPQIKEIKTVVLDTASELYNLDLEMQVKAAIDKDARRKGDSIDDPQPGDFGETGRRLSRVLRYLKDLPNINLLVLAHTDEVWEKSERDKFKKVAEEDKKLREITVGISPLVRRQATGFMDFVWYLHVTPEGKRIILTQQSGAYYAKTRGSLFAARIGKSITWVEGDPLMARLYQSLLDKTPLSVEKEETK